MHLLLHYALFSQRGTFDVITYFDVIFLVLSRNGKESFNNADPDPDYLRGALSNEYAFLV